MTKEDHILTKIKDAYDLSYAEIAKELGVSRQYLSNVYTGYRNMSPAIKRKLQTIYKEFFEEQKQTSSVLKINYCPDQQIPHSFNLFSRHFQVVSVDKLLLPRTITINQNASYIVTLSDDSLSPFYLKGDKVILDTSQTRVKDGLSYLISCNNVYYIRKLKVLPDKIKCISTKDDRDTFYCEAKNFKVHGLIVPNVRF